MLLKRIAIFYVVLIILFPLFGGIVMAETLPDDYTQQTQRDKAQGNKLIKNSLNDSDAIERNANQFNLAGQSSSNSSLSDDPVHDFSNSGYKLAFDIIMEVQRLSLPACALLIIAGAIIRYILGIKNMARKKYGRVLMLGAYTLWVLAQIVPVVFLIWIRQQ